MIEPKTGPQGGGFLDIIGSVGGALPEAPDSPLSVLQALGADLGKMQKAPDVPLTAAERSAARWDAARRMRQEALTTSRRSDVTPLQVASAYVDAAAMSAIGETAGGLVGKIAQAPVMLTEFPSRIANYAFRAATGQDAPEYVDGLWQGMFGTPAPAAVRYASGFNVSGKALNRDAAEQREGVLPEGLTDAQVSAAVGRFARYSAPAIAQDIGAAIGDVGIMVLMALSAAPTGGATAPAAAASAGRLASFFRPIGVALRNSGNRAFMAYMGGRMGMEMGNEYRDFVERENEAIGRYNVAIENLGLSDVYGKVDPIDHSTAKELGLFAAAATVTAATELIGNGFSIVAAKTIRNRLVGDLSAKAMQGGMRGVMQGARAGAAGALKVGVPEAVEEAVENFGHALIRSTFDYTIDGGFAAAARSGGRIDPLEVLKGAGEDMLYEGAIAMIATAPLGYAGGRARYDRRRRFHEAFEAASLRDRVRESQTGRADGAVDLVASRAVAAAIEGNADPVVMREAVARMRERMPQIGSATVADITDPAFVAAFVEAFPVTSAAIAESRSPSRSGLEWLVGSARGTVVPNSSARATFHSLVKDRVRAMVPEYMRQWYDRSATEVAELRRKLSELGDRSDEEAVLVRAQAGQRIEFVRMVMNRMKEAWANGEVVSQEQFNEWLRLTDEVGAVDETGTADASATSSSTAARSTPEALAEMERARAGDTDAMLAMAARFERGDGVERHPMKSLYWMNRALASADDVQAMVWLGQYYEGRIGGGDVGRPRSIDRARALYRKAYELGSDEAGALLAELESSGKPGPRVPRPGRIDAAEAARSRRAQPVQAPAAAAAPPPVLAATPEAAAEPVPDDPAVRMANRLRMDAERMAATRRAEAAAAAAGQADAEAATAAERQRRQQAQAERSERNRSRGEAARQRARAAAAAPDAVADPAPAEQPQAAAEDADPNAAEAARIQSRLRAADGATGQERVRMVEADTPVRRRIAKVAEKLGKQVRFVAIERLRGAIVRGFVGSDPNVIYIAVAPKQAEESVSDRAVEMYYLQALLHENAHLALDADRSLRDRVDRVVTNRLRSQFASRFDLGRTMEEANEEVRVYTLTQDIVESSGAADLLMGEGVASRISARLKEMFSKALPFLPEARRKSLLADILREQLRQAASAAPESATAPAPAPAPSPAPEPPRASPPPEPVVVSDADLPADAAAINSLLRGGTSVEVRTADKMVVLNTSSESRGVSVVERLGRVMLLEGSTASEVVSYRPQVSPVRGRARRKGEAAPPPQASPEQAPAPADTALPAKPVKAKAAKVALPAKPAEVSKPSKARNVPFWSLDPSIPDGHARLVDGPGETSIVPLGVPGVRANIVVTGKEREKILAGLMANPKRRVSQGPKAPAARSRPSKVIKKANDAQLLKLADSMFDLMPESNRNDAGGLMVVDGNRLVVPARNYGQSTGVVMVHVIQGDWGADGAYSVTDGRMVASDRVHSIPSVGQILIDGGSAAARVELEFQIESLNRSMSVAASSKGELSTTTISRNADQSVGYTTLVVSEAKRETIAIGQSRVVEGGTPLATVPSRMLLDTMRLHTAYGSVFAFIRVGNNRLQIESVSPGRGTMTSVIMLSQNPEGTVSIEDTIRGEGIRFMREREARGARVDPANEPVASELPRPKRGQRGRNGGEQVMFMREKRWGVPRMGSAFSGMGTWEIALRGLAEPVRGVEISPNIAVAYALNNGDHVEVADVTKVPSDFAKDMDLFCASPVCKAYSDANRNRGEQGLDIASANWVASVIRDSRPANVAIENVPSYRSSDAYQIIESSLLEAGYQFDAVVYDASDFGAATSRRRLIIRATLGTLPAPPTPTHGITGRPKVGWMDAAGDLMDSLPSAPPIKPGSLVDQWLADEGGLGSEPLLIMGSPPGRGTKRVGIRTTRRGNEPSPTIKATPKEVIRVWTGSEMKRATPRFLARLHGITDDVALPSDERLAKTVIGNGIPLQLVKSVVGPMVQSDGGLRFMRERLTSMDAPYMAAVERGDMVTAQRMVDEAAAASGMMFRGHKRGRPQGSTETFASQSREQAQRFANQHSDGVVSLVRFTKPLRVYEREIGWQEYQDSWRNSVLLKGYDAVRVVEPNGQDISLAIRNPAAIKFESAEPVTSDAQGNVVPLSRRFDDSTGDIRFMRERTDAQLSADHAAAFVRGDVEAAAEIVREYGRRKGYATEAYHGTFYNFNEFSLPASMSGDIGFHFGTRSAAENRLKDLREQRPPAFGDPSGRIIPVYLRAQNLIRMRETRTNTWPIGVVLNQIFEAETVLPEFEQDADAFFDDALQSTVNGEVVSYDNVLPNRADETEWVGNYLRSKGFDGIVYENRVEGGTSYIVFFPEQIKSAEPFTYDKDGKLIPLDKRFDDSTGDIRFMRERDSDVIESLKDGSPEGSHTHSLATALFWKYTVLDKAVKSARRQLGIEMEPDDQPNLLFQLAPGVQKMILKKFGAEEEKPFLAAVKELAKRQRLRQDAVMDRVQEHAFLWHALDVMAWLRTRDASRIEREIERRIEDMEARGEYVPADEIAAEVAEQLGSLGVTEDVALARIEEIERDFDKDGGWYDLSDRLRAMNRRTLDLSRESGQITEATYQELIKRYPNYVPVVVSIFDDPSTEDDTDVKRPSIRMLRSMRGGGLSKDKSARRYWAASWDLTRHDRMKAAALASMAPADNAMGRLARVEALKRSGGGSLIELVDERELVIGEIKREQMRIRNDFEAARRKAEKEGLPPPERPEVNSEAIARAAMERVTAQIDRDVSGTATASPNVRRYKLDRDTDMTPPEARADIETFEAMGLTEAQLDENAAAEWRGEALPHKPIKPGTKAHAKKLEALRKKIRILPKGTVQHYRINDPVLASAMLTDPQTMLERWRAGDGRVKRTIALGWLGLMSFARFAYINANPVFWVGESERSPLQAYVMTSVMAQELGLPQETQRKVMDNLNRILGRPLVQPLVGYFGAIRSFPGLSPVWRSARRAMLGMEPRNAYERLIRQAEEDGVLQGTLYSIKSQQVMIDDLRRRIRLTNAGKIAGKSRLDAIRDVGKGIENFFEQIIGGIDLVNRMNVYQAAIEAGVDRKQAAVMAREATVDFAKRGGGAGIKNASNLYLFINPRMQGIHQLVRAVSTTGWRGLAAKGPSGSVRLLMKMYGWSFLLKLVTEMFWEEDDDPQTELSQFASLQNLLVPLPLTNEKGQSIYLKQSLPYGFGAAAKIGSRTAEFLMGDSTPLEFLAGAIGDVGSELTPLAFDAADPASIGQAVVPTNLATLSDILVFNRDWKGSPIYPKGATFGPGEPRRSQQYFAADTWRINIWMANTLADLTKPIAEAAGFEGQRGIEVSPNQIQYAIERYIPGIAREAIRLGALSSNMATGRETPLVNKPLVGAFVAQSGGRSVVAGRWRDLGRIRENMKQDIRERKDTIPTLRARYGEVGNWLNTGRFDRANTEIRRLQEQRNDLARAGRWKEVDQVNARIELIQTTVLREYGKVRIRSGGGGIDTRFQREVLGRGER